MFGVSWRACLASSLVLLAATNAASAQNGPLAGAGPLKGSGPIEGTAGIPSLQPTVGMNPLQGAEPAFVPPPVGALLETAISPVGITTALPVQLLEVAVLPMPALTLASFSPPQPASVALDPVRAKSLPSPAPLTLTYLNVERGQSERARSGEQQVATVPPVIRLPPVVNVPPARHISPN